MTCKRAWMVFKHTSNQRVLVGQDDVKITSSVSLAEAWRRGVQHTVAACCLPACRLWRLAPAGGLAAEGWSGYHRMTDLCRCRNAMSWEHGAFVRILLVLGPLGTASAQSLTSSAARRRRYKHNILQFCMPRCAVLHYDMKYGMYSISIRHSGPYLQVRSAFLVMLCIQSKAKGGRASTKQLSQLAPPCGLMHEFGIDC